MVSASAKGARRGGTVVTRLHSDERIVTAGRTLLGLRRQASSQDDAISLSFFFFNDTATTEIYTLSLHDALPIYDGYMPELRRGGARRHREGSRAAGRTARRVADHHRELCAVIRTRRRRSCVRGQIGRASCRERV